MTPVPSIDQIQPDIYFKLASESVFAPVVVFQVAQQRTSSEIDERLSNLTGDSRQGSLKKPGASIVVNQPSFGNVGANAPGPLAELRQKITVKTNPRINIEAPGGTGVTTLKWAQNVWQAIHLFTLQGIAQTIYALAITPNNEFEHLDLEAYDVTLAATFPLQAPLRVYTPNIAIVGGTVTLTPTPSQQGDTNPQPAGVTTVYTTDGSFPGTVNPTALVYSAPFNVPRGTIIRWAAYATGYNGSDTGWANWS